MSDKPQVQAGFEFGGIPRPHESFDVYAGTEPRTLRVQLRGGLDSRVEVSADETAPEVIDRERPALTVLGRRIAIKNLGPLEQSVVAGSADGVFAGEFTGDLKPGTSESLFTGGKLTAFLVGFRGSIDGQSRLEVSADGVRVVIAPQWSPVLVQGTSVEVHNVGAVPQGFSASVIRFS
jgi:hypothetical protein